MRISKDGRRPRARPARGEEESTASSFARSSFRICRSTDEDRRIGLAEGAPRAEEAAVATGLVQAGTAFTALEQKESSLEDIFVDLVERQGLAA